MIRFKQIVDNRGYLNLQLSDRREPSAMHVFVLRGGEEGWISLEAKIKQKQNTQKNNWYIYSKAKVNIIRPNNNIYNDNI